MTARAILRPDGRYNFTVSNLTLVVLDETTLNGMGEFKGQLLSQAGANPDVFGALSLAAMMTGGQVEYLTENIKRVFGEQ